MNRTGRLRPRRALRALLHSQRYPLQTGRFRPASLVPVLEWRRPECRQTDSLHSRSWASPALSVFSVSRSLPPSPRPLARMASERDGERFQDSDFLGKQDAGQLFHPRRRESVPRVPGVVQ